MRADGGFPKEVPGCGRVVVDVVALVVLVLAGLLG